MCDEIPSVVLDNGSALSKAGFSSEEKPHSIYPTEDSSNRISPIKNGIITDWEAMEKVWQHTFDKVLRIEAKDHPIVLTQPPLNPNKNKEKIVETMFEKFQFEHVFLSVDAVLSHLASGRHAGVFVQIGDGVTSVVPIEGLYPVPDAIIRSNIAGHEVTKYLQQILEEKGCNVDVKNAQTIKEEICYVNRKGSTDAEPTQYTLPDGTILNLSYEKYICSEPLFNPLLLDREAPGVHEMIYKSIMKCSIDLRATFWNNIILSGGTAMFPGFDERLHSEIEAKIARNNFNIVENVNERKYYSWLGGSVLSSLSTFKNMCIKREEYEELGAHVVHERCFKGIQ